MLALAVGGVLAPERATGQSASAPDDMAMYSAVVARVHAGQDYWDAAEIELRRGDYPLRPMFNWRQPLYAWLFAALPSPLIGQAILIVIALVVVLLGYQTLRPEGL